MRAVSRIVDSLIVLLSVSKWVSCGLCRFYIITPPPLPRLLGSSARTLGLKCIKLIAVSVAVYGRRGIGPGQLWLVFIAFVVTNLISIAASASASASVCTPLSPLIDSSLPSLMPFDHIELYAAYSPLEKAWSTK